MSFLDVAPFAVILTLLPCRDKEESGPPAKRLAAGKAAGVIQHVDNRLLQFTQSPNSLNNSSLVELHSILSAAVKAHSPDFKVTAAMLDNFVEAIYTDWAHPLHHLQAPGVPEILPYSEENGIRDDDLLYYFEGPFLTPAECEFHDV